MLTREKTAAASFCDSPYHLSVKDDTCKLIKRQPEIKGEGTEGKSKIGHYFKVKNNPQTFLPASFAVALAIIVFPQPGGPYSSTP